MPTAAAKLPLASSLDTKTLVEPAKEPVARRVYVPTPGSKSTEPLNRPVVYTFPAPSTATSNPAAEAFLPPMLLAQDSCRGPPAPGASLTTKLSWLPLRVSLYVLLGSGSKSLFCDAALPPQPPVT